MSSFENLRIVDNFYQTSLYFPMPTVIISTLCEDGSTTLGPYSLVQPYYVAGKDYYAMLLELVQHGPKHPAEREVRHQLHRRQARHLQGGRQALLARRQALRQDAQVQIPPGEEPDSGTDRGAPSHGSDRRHPGH